MGKMIKRVLLVIIVVCVLIMVYAATNWAQFTSMFSETDQQTSYTEEVDGSEAESTNDNSDEASSSDTDTTDDSDNAEE